MATLRRFTPHEDQLLGHDSDTKIAELLGRTRGSVSQRRSWLGIPPFSKNEFIDMSGQQVGWWKVLHLDPQCSSGTNKKWICICTRCNTQHSVIGHRMQCGKSTQCKSCGNKNQDHTNTPRTIKLIDISLIKAAVEDGCASQSAVADWIGCSVSGVSMEIRNARRKGLVSQGEVVAWFGARANRLLAEERDQLRSLLGTVSDADLAREFGVSPAMVCRARRNAGIPFYKPQKVG